MRSTALEFLANAGLQIESDETDVSGPYTICEGSTGKHRVRYVVRAIQTPCLSWLQNCRAIVHPPCKVPSAKPNLPNISPFDI